MAFQPIVAGTGLVAWKALQRTMDRQMQVFSGTSEQTRAADHFRDVASSFRSAADLVADRTSFSVVLGAYGLSDDIQNKFFVQKILEEGVSDPRALANRLADARYRRMTGDLGFDSIAKLVGIQSTRTEKIVNEFNRQRFVEAVGETHPDLRLALNAEAEIGKIAGQDVSSDAKWFLVMGNPPLRQVFESAFNLPQSVGRLDLDQQLNIFREQSERFFGISDVSGFENDEMQEKLINRFLLSQQIQAGSAMSGTSIALQLLNSR